MEELLVDSPSIVIMVVSDDEIKRYQSGVFFSDKSGFFTGQLHKFAGSSSFLSNMDSNISHIPRYVYRIPASSEGSCLNPQGMVCRHPLSSIQHPLEDPGIICLCINNTKMKSFAS